MTEHYKNNINQHVLPWLAILACFSVSMGTAVLSINIGIFCILWLISGEYALKLNRIKSNYAAIIPIILFALYGLGLIYSNIPWQSKLAWWMKYHKLLYIPMIVSVMTTDQHRKYAMNAFLIGTLVVLAVSYLKWLTILPFDDVGQGYIAFRNRISQSIFMAYGVYLMYQQALKLKGGVRLTWLLFALLSIIDIFVLVNGRTGQVLLIALTFWFIYESWGAKSIKWQAAIIITVLTVVSWTDIQPHSRLTGIKDEIAEHDPMGHETSAGLRLEFYKNAMILISQHPIIGSGTGSFAQEYRKLSEHEGIKSTYVPNPHNQYLLTMQELGVIGLLTLLAFWILHWRSSFMLPQRNSQVALRGLIITIALGSLFNSLLLDAGEGRFYCVMAGVLLSAYLPKKSSL